MPFGHFEKSFVSRPAQSVSADLGFFGQIFQRDAALEPDASQVRSEGFALTHDSRRLSQERYQPSSAALGGKMPPSAAHRCRFSTRQLRNRAKGRLRRRNQAGATTAAPGPLVEFPARRGLLDADTAGDDLRPRVVLAFHLGAGQTAKHRELTDVGQRIGDRALEQLLERRQQAARRRPGNRRTAAAPRESVRPPRSMAADRSLSTPRFPSPASAPSRRGRPGGPGFSPASGAIRQGCTTRSCRVRRARPCRHDRRRSRPYV